MYEASRLTELSQPLPDGDDLNDLYRAVMNKRSPLFSSGFLQSSSLVFVISPPRQTALVLDGVFRYDHRSLDQSRAAI
jgi:hypothetical protein